MNMSIISWVYLCYAEEKAHISDYATIDEIWNTEAGYLKSEKADGYEVVNEAEANRRPEKGNSASLWEAINQDTSRTKIPISSLSSSYLTLPLPSNFEKSVPEEGKKENGRSKLPTLPGETETTEPELYEKTESVSGESTGPKPLARRRANTQNKQVTLAKNSQEVKTSNEKDTKALAGIVLSALGDDSTARQEHASSTDDSITEAPEDPDNVYDNVALGAPMSKPIQVVDLPAYVKEQNKTGGFKAEMEVNALIVTRFKSLLINHHFTTVYG